jgi:hypothetical protein
MAEMARRLCNAGRGRSGEVGMVLLIVLLAGGFVSAQEKPKDGPRAITHTPLALTPGTTITLKVRGMKLNAAGEVRVEGGNVPVKVQLKEKKTAEVPNGLDAKDVGDSVVVAEISAPADLSPGLLRVSIVCPEGTASGELRVVAASGQIDEKEPNNGFREAQRIECGRTVRGGIKEDKDVDTFQFEGRAGQRIVADVLARRAGSLLDGVLTVYDARGRFLASNDDGAGRDPQLAFALPADGKYFLTVTDAQDRGGEWHGYELTIEEAK